MGVTVATLVAFCWTALLIELTPGPNMTYLALLSGRQGARVGLAAVAGVAVGLLAIGLAAALGVGALIERSPLLYETIRWAGLMYLLWLAVEAWRGEDVTAVAPGQAALTAFRNGLVTNLLNPKAALFYVAVLPVFTDTAKAYAPQASALTLAYVAIATFIHVLIVLAADYTGRALATEQWRRNAGRVMGVALALVAVWMFFATKRVV